MQNFEFREYLINGCILSIVVFVFAVFLMVLGMFLFVKVYRKLQNFSFMKRMFLLTGSVMMVSVGMIFLVSSNQTLEYGIHLMGESEKDAIEIVGRVDKIELLSIPPYYLYNGKRATQTAEVQIDGSTYYFMSAEGLSVHDTIQFRYLPKSKMVLSYQEIPYSEWTPPVVDSGEKQVDGLLVIILILGIIVFFLFAYTPSLFGKMAQKVMKDDLEWTQNEVRYHSSYRDGAITFSLVILIFGVIITILHRDPLIVASVLVVMIGVLAISFGKYKYWKLEYHDNELVLHYSAGRKEIIPTANILSVEDKLESLFISKGAIYQIVQIKYRTNVKGIPIQSVIKLDYRYQVGITRFLSFLEEININIITT